MTVDHTRYIDVGFHNALDEEEVVRGWAKLLLFFSKEVYILIDPDTTDNTEKILRDEFPQIHIRFQDLNLGDSNYYHQGPKKHLRMHMNSTHFVNNEIKDGQWIFYFAADERFHPDDLIKINKTIKIAQENNLDGVMIRKMKEFLTETECVELSKYFTVTQSKFFKKPTQKWIHNPKPHSGMSWFPSRKKRKDLFVPLYHYPQYKNKQKLWDNWVYKGYNTTFKRLQKKFGIIPLHTPSKPILKWKEYPYLNNEGKLIKEENE